MNLNEKISSLSIGNRDLRYYLSIIFSFFFFAPFLGLLYFGLKYDLGKDDSLPFFIILLLTSLLVGYILIRRVFDRIHRVYIEAGDLTKAIDAPNRNSFQNELQGILHLFQVINQKINSSSEIIAKHGAQISTLKELSERCYLTFDSDDLFQVTLEMAMKLTNADIGSVLLLTGKERDKFVVRASYGLGDIITTGDTMDFSTSIAKYAIINKSPLLVDDMENDRRFAGKTDLITRQNHFSACRSKEWRISSAFLTFPERMKIPLLPLMR